ncbi:MAG: ribosome biogenesis GTP-binding protein YihA/YsxC [Opitutaceae bacterium]
MKIKSAEFVQSSPELKGCPVWARPEFAFIGRSNVGKSSLINLLTERRELARVSDTPGKTQLINFYLINGAWSLVDLPGYGYARVGKEQRYGFNQAVADFLEKRKNLRMAFVLIDSRLPPQAIDLEFLGWLGNCVVPYALVFTKTDKISATQVKNNVEAIMKAVRGTDRISGEIFLTSAKTKAGRAEVLRRIEATLQEPEN